MVFGKGCEVKCTETVYERDGWHSHRCTRNVWKDGCCKQHHPDTVEARRKAADKRWEESAAKSPTARLIVCKARLSEVISLAKEFDLAVCRCDHGCDGRMSLQGPRCARCVARDRFYQIVKEEETK